MRFAYLLATTVCLLLVGATTERSMPTTAVASVDTVAVSPHLDTLQLREGAAISARVVDSVGRPKNTEVTWTSRNTSVVKVGNVKFTLGLSKAIVRAGSDTGRTYVVATAGSKKDSSLYIVRDTICSTAILGSLQFGPDSITMHRTDTVGLSVVPRNQCGGYLNGVNPTFSSSSASVATATRVDSLWVRVIALDSNGTTYVKAVSGSIRDSVKVKAKHAP